MTGIKPLSAAAGNEIRRRFLKVLSPSGLKTYEPMSRHTTFRVGGPADYHITPGSADEISGAVGICREYGLEFHIIGNGSNLIVRDKGIRGAVIQLRERFAGCIIREDGMVEAEAGALLSEIAAMAYDSSLTGIEFASGIPGTAGGAVSMNAGAYGAEMKDITVRTVCLRPDDGVICAVEGEDHRFGYRTSFVQETGAIILKVFLKLKRADKSSISELMDEYRSRRKDKQPLEYPSAGSIYKSRINDGIYAWKLIDGCGLRGLSSGGAQISEKHCGFIINRGGASAADIIDLILTTEKKVRENYGIELATEVRIIGEE